MLLSRDVEYLMNSPPQCRRHEDRGVRQILDIPFCFSYKANISAKIRYNVGMHSV